MRFLTITALLALTGCKGCRDRGEDTDNDNGSHTSQTGNGGSSEETSGINLTITANIPTYAFDGDTVVVTKTNDDVPGVSIDTLDKKGNLVEMKDKDGTKVESTVAKVVNFTPGSYTFLFDYVNGDGFGYLAEVDDEITENTTLDVELCDDLSGNWFIESDSGSTTFDASDTEMDGCTVNINGFGELTMTSNYGLYDGNDGKIELIHNHDSDTLRVHDVNYDVWFTGSRTQTD